MKKIIFIITVGTTFGLVIGGSMALGLKRAYQRKKTGKPPKAISC